jgi:hypothetical protein
MGSGVALLNPVNINVKVDEETKAQLESIVEANVEDGKSANNISKVVREAVETYIQTQQAEGRGYTLLCLELGPDLRDDVQTRAQAMGLSDAALAGIALRHFLHPETENIDPSTLEWIRRVNAQGAWDRALMEGRSPVNETIALTRSDPPENPLSSISLFRYLAVHTNWEAVLFGILSRQLHDMGEAAKEPGNQGTAAGQRPRK